MIYLRDLQVLTELDQISMRLQEDGLPPGAGAEERQRHLWQLLLNSEANLQSGNQELQNLRTQQAIEMKEVRHFGVSYSPIVSTISIQTSFASRPH